MQPEDLKKYEGKKCRVVLLNNYNYTFIMPKIEGTSIKFIDKFGKTGTIQCSYIGLVEVLEDRYG